MIAKKFKNVAQLVRKSRTSIYPELSQERLAQDLSFKNGQFISNVERGICSIPLEKAATFCKLVDIEKSVFVEAYTKDIESYATLVLDSSNI